MSTVKPSQATSSKGRGASIFVALGFGFYSLGLVLGHQGTKAFDTRDVRVVRPPTGPAQKPADSDSFSPSANSSQAAVSPFFPGLTNVLQAFEAKARQLEDRGRAKEELHLLKPLLLLLSSNDYPRVWTILKNLRSADQRDELQRRLLQLWSRLDPRAALKAVQAPAQTNAADWQINEVLSGWVEKDADAALAFERSLPETQQDGALRAVIAGLANYNPKAAAQLLAGLPGTGDKWVMAMGVLNRLAPLDPDAALSFLDQTGLAGYRDEGFALIAAVRATRSIPDTLSWAQTLPSGTDKDTVFRAVVSRLASIQPEQAVQFLLSQPESKQCQLAGPLAETWGKLDPRSAAAWVCQLPDGPLRQETCAGVERSWAPEDPEATANFLLNSLPPGGSRASLLKDVARTWCWYGLDAQAAMTWADQLPIGTEHDAFLSGMSQGLAAEDPSRAAPLAASIATGEIQAEALKNLAVTWVLQHNCGQDAAAWSAALPPGPTRVAAMAAISEDWAILDPVASEAWLESLPADDARAKAAEAYVAWTVQPRPDLAARWVNSIADDKQRHQQLEAIASQWLKNDPLAAQAWLQQTSLPGQRTEQLQNK